MNPYGAIKFGEFKTYMTNKRAKLKDQEKILEGSASQTVPQIFEGLSIYINGYTNPPQSELRTQIILHGGDYQHYSKLHNNIIVKKSSVTHIIATNLTHAKCNEFRAYKVVKPNWLMDSIKEQRLLPWNDYRITGKDAAQRELQFQRSKKQQQQQQQQHEEEDNTKKPLEGKALNATLLAKSWNRENTSVNPGFVKKFYSSSRLHHLSTWKSEIKAEIIKRLDEKFGREAGGSLGKKRKRNGERLVMHIDFDCFFASVGLLDRPELKNQPVAVSHVQQAKIDSSSDIASCNYIARASGVRNGMHVGTAKQRCPELQVIPYEFEKYRAISEIFYETLYGFAEEIEPVSVDEALIEIDGDEEAGIVATQIRNAIREKTRCEVSIGIGPNILLARLATKKAKPAGQYYCSAEEVQDFSVSDLPRIGPSMTEKLAGMGILTVADILRTKLPMLQSNFGPKTGKMLYEYSRGIDERPLKHEQERQSVSADVNWGVRFENEEQVKRFVDELAEEVTERLHGVQRKGKRITLNVLRRCLDAGEASKRLGCGECDSFSKSISLTIATDDPKAISHHVYDMLLSYKFDVTDLRGLGINITKLESVDDNSKVVKQQKLSFTPSYESTKSKQFPSEVDPEVFAELPTAVQDELKHQYKISLPSSKQTDSQISPQLSPQKKKQTSVVVDGCKKNTAMVEGPCSSEDSVNNEPLASLPDIPPWSQLDPGSLLALPEAMRKQVLELYSGKLPKRKQNDVELPPQQEEQQRLQQSDNMFSSRGRPQLTKKSYRLKGSSKNSTTLTQMFNTTKSPSREDKTVHSSPWESAIWAELPASMQAEIQADQRREQLVRERNIRNDHFREARTKLMKNASSTTKIMDLPLPVQNEPKLLGNSSIEGVRTVLHEWVESFPLGPEDEDAGVVVKFLQQLVQTKDLEKAQLAIMYFDEVTKEKGDVWCIFADKLKQAVSDATEALYMCRLQF
ncbi:hypothetical protein BDC45DRAFT_7834 [Circinella umbellata]|nr:hypothetical protein BDC45DRAFT_7834 [Circinella umbellata]